MTTHIVRSALAAILAGASASAACAQSLASRVNAAPEGRVQFSFATRPGVCGNGRSYIQTGPNSFSGSFYGNFNDGVRSDPCVAGPVRVVLDRTGRDVLSVQAYVGPLPATPVPGTTDLGTVRAGDAAAYLLSLAAQSDGRAGRDAILPAMLADSANTTRDLLAIARDQARPRETRRSALSWLGRSTEDQQSIPPAVTDALLQIARDDTDNQSVRQHALSVLARLEHGAGIRPLIELANATDHNWLAKEANSALARSGDPRARDYLRSAVRRTDLPDDVLSTAIRGLGTEFATSTDAALLRDIYPKLTGERSREAALSALAESGGAENTRWLLALARNEGESWQSRRRALNMAARAGVPSADMVKMYDTTTDPQMKEALISLYVQTGDKASVDKLLAIAKSEENQMLRRRTISQLSRSEDPRVKEFLKEIIER
jgi:HEAT repeat protein